MYLPCRIIIMKSFFFTEEYNTSCYDFQTDIKTSPTSTFLLHSDKEEPEIKHWKDLNTLR